MPGEATEPLAGLRVLLLGPVEPPVGGVSRYCRALGGALRRAGAEVETRDLDRLAPGPAAAVLAARDAVSSRSSSLVIDNHQHFWRRRRYAWGVMRASRLPYVLVIHHGRFPEVLRGTSRFARWVLARGLERSAGVICIGEEIADAVHALAPRARTRVLTPLFPVEPEGDVGPLPDAPGERYLCFGGALGELYGVGDILEAFPRLVRELPDLHLVLLVGSFLREETTVRRLDRLDEETRSRVCVLEDHPRGSRVIERAAVYVRCSRADSYGLGIQEARIAGVPVVASRIRGRPPGALLYEPGNVDDLVQALRRALGEAARREARSRCHEVLEEARVNARETLRFLREVS